MTLARLGKCVATTPFSPAPNLFRLRILRCAHHVPAMTASLGREAAHGAGFLYSAWSYHRKVRGGSALFPTSTGFIVRVLRRAHHSALHHLPTCGIADEMGS